MTFSLFIWIHLCYHVSLQPNMIQDRFELFYFILLFIFFLFSDPRLHDELSHDQSEPGAERIVQQFDLPPEEWRWLKDGPAQRGGSALSAAAARWHAQTSPSTGNALLNFHATTGLTAGATHAQSQRSKVQGEYPYNLTTYLVRPCVHVRRRPVYNSTLELIFQHFSDRFVRFVSFKRVSSVSICGIWTLHDSLQH